MLDAEALVRRGMWGGPDWRRASMTRGELTITGGPGDGGAS
jgi:hypothetical protein